MPRALTKTLLLFATLVIASPAFAQTDEYDEEQLKEIERREAFQTGMQAIVADLNNSIFNSVASAIHREKALEAIFGLRLIDRKIRNRFEENFVEDVPTIIRQEFESYGENFRATLLDVASSGDRGRALVRYDLPDFQFNYHEYDLLLDDDGTLRIIDWVDFLSGEPFSQTVGEMLVAAAPNRQAVRKLLDVDRPTDAEIFQVAELLKAGRDRQRDRFLEIHKTLTPELQSQRAVVMSYVHLMQKLRSRRGMRGALIEVATHFPDEPLYSLMLLDYYFPTRRYQEAYDALLRLEQRLGVDDSAMKARLSAATLILGQTQDALAYAQQANTLEPGLELGWWSLLRASVVGGHYEQSTLALSRLEDDFGHRLDGAAFEKDPAFHQFIASPEFAAWSEPRH